MDYGMIGKIEKAKRYAQERERFRFDQFSVTFSGENNDHQVSFAAGVFKCDCEIFFLRHRGSHTMALEHLLNNRRARSLCPYIPLPTTTSVLRAKRGSFGPPRPPAGP